MGEREDFGRGMANDDFPNSRRERSFIRLHVGQIYEHFIEDVMLAMKSFTSPPKP